MFSLEIPSVPVAKFPAAAEQALSSLATAEHNDEELGQARAAVVAAIKMVKAGLGGAENVYVVISGHANAGHEMIPVPGASVGSSLSVGVHERRSPGGES
jgi:hypothetical protein